MAKGLTIEELSRSGLVEHRGSLISLEALHAYGLEHINEQIAKEQADGTRARA